MPAKKEVTDCCQVCSAVGHGYHFGVVACRACAAFFRRTTAFHLKYNCRSGGRCKVDKSEGRICRKCRHIKCLKVGMVPDTIQLHRDTFGGTPKKKPTVEVMQNVPTTSSAIPSKGETLRLTAKEMLLARVNQMFNQASLCNDRTTLPSILDEMCQSYYDVVRSRENLYVNLKMVSPTGFENEEEENERALANCGIFVRMLMNEVELAARMLTRCRPFMELPRSERMLLFERFWPIYLRFERSYVTYLTLGPNVNDYRVVLYDGTIAGGPKSLAIFRRLCRMSEAEIENLFQPSHEITLFYVDAPLKLLRPTEFEFIAMSLHVLWTAPNMEGISEETLQTAREVRSKIYTELHHYYTRVAQIQVYAPRIGELLCIMAAVENTVERAKDDVLLIKLFDLAAIDSKMMDFFA